MQHSFVYDDESTIIHNYFIRHWSNLFNLFTSKYFALSAELTYRPVVTLSYFIDYTFWQLNPLGYHLTNMLLHATNGTLFFIFAFHVFKKRTTSLISALFFSSCPLFSEVVNAVGFREDLLAFLFLILAFIFYLKVDSISFQAKHGTFSSFSRRTESKGIRAVPHLSPPGEGGERGEVIRSQRVPLEVERLQKRRELRYILYYSLSLICYFLSLFSKEMAITLPLLIVLYDIVFRDLSFKKNLSSSSVPDRGVMPSYLKSKIIQHYLGFFLITIFYLVIRFFFLHNPLESHTHYLHNSLFVNFLTMTHVLAYYVKLLFMPFKLNADYVVPFLPSLVHISFWVSVLLFITIGIVTFRLRSQHKYVFFFILWFFVTLIPVMNIIPLGNIMAERYLYIPGAGVSMIVAVLLSKMQNKHSTARYNQSVADISSRFQAGDSKGNYFTPSASLPCEDGDKGVVTWLWSSCAIVFFILMGNAYLTLTRNNDWKDGLQLWSKTVRDSPNSFRAHINLGNAYEKMGFNTAAFEEYKRALSMNPNDADVYNNLGIYYNKINLFNEAVEYYKKCLAINPKHAKAHNNLGVVLTRQRRLDDAIQAFGRAVSINPLYPDAHNNLGIAYYRKGHMDDAEREFKLAISIESYHAEAHNDLGILYNNRQLYDDAIHEFEIAIRIKPDYANAHMNLGAVIFKHRKDKETAMFHLKESLKLDPQQEQADGIKKLIQQLEESAIVH
ncbi:MAG: tetratricopeptide repeat protein [Candidatus Brocadia sp.]|nr:tetratricopeptide repeat protein [Candidatus Brocadia sp.]